MPPSPPALTAALGHDLGDRTRREMLLGCDWSGHCDHFRGKAKWHHGRFFPPCPQLLLLVPIRPGVCIMLKQHFSSAFPVLWESWAFGECPECDPLRRWSIAKLSPFKLQTTGNSCSSWIIYQVGVWGCLPFEHGQKAVFGWCLQQPLTSSSSSGILTED